jgi:L-lactate dehydrogenase
MPDSKTKHAPRFKAAALTQFAHALLSKAGLNDDKASAVAGILVQGDLMGHTTHGLAQLQGYLRELENGTMRKEGGPITVNDQPAAITWDGQRLPGPWLVLQAMDLATTRARTQGTGTVVIRRSHHIACLAAYHQRATDQGLMMILTCSDFNSASVAPFGGLDAVFTPNPISAGIPTSGVPVVLDVSCSTTTNGLTNRLKTEGKQLAAPWLLDGQGQPSRDPNVLFATPKGTILPLGGVDSGHKGYSLTWLVEALTGGLAGLGRADAKEGWGATVFLQIIDPRAFSGIDAFTRQTDQITRLCHDSRPIHAGEAVRTPGERGAKLAQQQLQNGVDLYPSILPDLQTWAQKFNVVMPQAL